MTQHTTVHGITVALITGEEFSQSVDRIALEWPHGRFQDLRRLVMDTLHDCSLFIDHYEDAARLRASPWRPIATAPRDGRTVLLFSGLPPEPYFLGFYSKTLARFVPEVAATHWMSLPAGPSSNDSARHNGQSETASAVHAKALHKLAASLICPPAADDDADQRARKAGIGA